MNSLIIIFGLQITTKLKTLKESNWSLWQFSDNGSVRGIKGPVDLDLFNGNLVDFKKYLLK